LLIHRIGSLFNISYTIVNLVSILSILMSRQLVPVASLLFSDILKNV